MSSKERLSYDVPSPVLSLLASQGNTNMAQLTVIFVTTVPPLSPTTPLPPPSAYTNPLLPPLSHTYSENSPPSHFKTLLEGVHNNDFANEPTHLIISTHTHTGVSGVEECACPAISHNTISNCCLISNFPKLTITRNANITNTLVNSATLTGNVEIGHPEKMGHPQKVRISGRVVPSSTPFVAHCNVPFEGYNCMWLTLASLVQVLAIEIGAESGGNR